MAATMPAALLGPAATHSATRSHVLWLVASPSLGTRGQKARRPRTASNAGMSVSPAMRVTNTPSPSTGANDR